MVLRAASGMSPPGGSDAFGSGLLFCSTTKLIEEKWGSPQGFGDLTNDTAAKTAWAV